MPQSDNNRNQKAKSAVDDAEAPLHSFAIGIAQVRAYKILRSRARIALERHD